MGLKGLTEQLRMKQAVAGFMGQGGPNSSLADWTVVE